MTFSKRTFAFVLALSGIAAAQRSAQDIESARQLFNQGIELRDKGDLAGALEKLRAAHALGNTPITGIELCRTHAALRQPVEAREVCLGVARIPPAPQETARSQEARVEAGKIAESERSKIGALKVRIAGVPAGMEPVVTIDGAPIPAAALNEPRAMNPGPHRVTARVGSGTPTTAAVETREGETREIELVVRAPDGPAAGAAPATTTPPPSTTTATPPAGGSNAGKAVSGVAFGLGGTALLVGLVAGIVAVGKESNLEEACPNERCGRAHWDDLDSARTWATVSTAFFVTSGVLLAAGLVTGIAIPGPAKSARTGVNVSLGGAGLHGAF